jgi:hypothetical protein
MFNPFSLPNTFNSFQIFESPHMVVYVGEDWSKVRSPGRARRRRKKHRQNITARYEPSSEFLINERARTIHCHPAMAAKLRAAVTSEVIR